MPLEHDLNEALKQAMRERDQPTADALRMLKTKLMERRTAKGFSGEVDDPLVVEVIGAYRKQLGKALEEFRAAGERGRDQARQIEHEMKVCERFLPARLSEEELRGVVRERIAALGLAGGKQAGRLMGEVMKAHKGRVDAADVKRVVEEELGA